jgi:RimJ/RimL family protein N-acetyltransferase
VDALAAENLILRKFVSDDAEQFVEAVRESASTVGQWLPWWKADFSEDDARSWFRTCEDAIAAGSGFDIGVFRKDDGLLVGSTAINRIDAANRQGSIGYWVRESLQGKGYCTEAVKRMSEFGFNVLALARLEFVVLVDNKPSRVVAERCGAKLECIAENRLVHRGHPTAAAIYSLICDRLPFR